MTKIYISQGIAPKVAENAHWYRQVFASIAATLLSVAGGITLGYTAVLLPQLETDPEFPYDKKYDSWIASISPLAMMIGCLFSGTMSDGIGRRKGQIILIIPFTIGWIIMGVATDNTMMLAGRFITGVCTGAIRPSTMVYVGELTDPKYRSVALFSPSLGVGVGAFISHTIGKYVYWKYSCIIFILPNIICLIILFFLKESPLWLISKGRYDEGIESFRLFRGTGDSSEKELAKVLQKNKEKAEQSFKDVLKIIFSKPFMISLANVTLLFIAVQWCGVNTISFYAQEIFQKTFGGDVDAFMLMLVTDVLRVLTGVIVCVLAKVIPRKITLVSCCFTVTLILVALIVYLYIKPVGLVWIAVTCMIIYVAVSSALTCISWSFVAEIFPSKVRGFGSGVSSAISFILLFISVKIMPTIIATYGEEFMYGGFAAVTLFTGIFLIFILPETSGKSLQDIEDDLYSKKEDKNKNVDMATFQPNTATQSV